MIKKQCKLTNFYKCLLLINIFMHKNTKCNLSDLLKINLS